jgi:hypothetical protein
MAEGNCTLLVALPDKVALPTQQEIATELENPDPARKSSALKKALMLLLAGEDMPRILMTVIRYCITVEDHTLQKLLMLYWEVARKYDASGKLLPEMILVWCVARSGDGHARPVVERPLPALHWARASGREPEQKGAIPVAWNRVPAMDRFLRFHNRRRHRRIRLTCPSVRHARPAACRVPPPVIRLLCSNALRNNLIHPNEYIRGCTLRFLCKLREPELLEPLVPSIKNCLAHRHPYVRRNAVLTVFSIFRQFPDLMPDAPEEVEKFLDEVGARGLTRGSRLHSARICSIGCE